MMFYERNGEIPKEIGLSADVEPRQTNGGAVSRCRVWWIRACSPFSRCSPLALLVISLSLFDFVFTPPPNDSDGGGRLSVKQRRGVVRCASPEEMKCRRNERSPDVTSGRRNCSREIERDQSGGMCAGKDK
ncbi:hypothetical protein Hanom_Chr09g00809171 [Helianthus anomalus]